MKELPRQDSVTELPLRVLIPWCLGIFLVMMTGCWLACDMMNEGKEPMPRIYYEETDNA